jgi:hypothetical protein
VGRPQGKPPPGAGSTGLPAAGDPPLLDHWLDRPVLAASQLARPASRGG